MKVFIDGENLRHRLVEVLYQEHLIHDRDDMFQADVRQLVYSALPEFPESIYYYTTRIKQPHFEVPELLTHKITNIQESHRRWIAMLTNQDIQVVKAGNLKVKESNACYHCGRRTMLLQEKGVDVRLASEVVMAAVHDNVQDIVVLSSDADMIPALNIARKGGAHITYLAFGEEVNHALEAATDKTVVYTREQIKQSFKGRLDRQPTQALPQAAHNDQPEADNGHGYQGNHATNYHGHHGFSGHNGRHEEYHGNH